MTHQDRYEIRECPNPGCQMRYPRFANSLGGENCPRCTTPTRIAATPLLNPDRPEPQGPGLRGQPVAALLDNIRSTFNVGSIFRTANGAGVQPLYLCGITPTPDNPKVGKTAVGAEKTLPWSYHHNAVSTAQTLKSQGARLWAFEGTPHAVNFFDTPAPPRHTSVVIVMGNEISGIDPELIALCDCTVWIPIEGDKESLNVAVAFGIAAYTLRWGQNPGG